MKNIFINSTLAFVSASVITTFVHESGHFFSYLSFGANPVLYSNYVYIAEQNIDISIRVVSAMAGPVFSLLQGLIFAFVISKNRNNTMLQLLFLWLSLKGFVNFFGYLMMTPLSTAGDTGVVAELLQISPVYRVLIAVTGFILVITLILRVGKRFADFIPAATEIKQKSKYVYSVMFFPIILGSLINTALAFPAPTWLSVVYPATSAYAIMSSFGAILKTESTHTSKSEIENKIQISLIILFVMMVIINRLLTLGFSFS